MSLRLKKASLVTGYGSLLILASVISFLKMGAYARFLDIELFGLVALLLSSYTALQYIGTIGAAEGVLKRASMVHDIDEKTIILSGGVFFGSMLAIGVGIVGALLAILLLPNIAFNLVMGFMLLTVASFVFRIIETSARVGRQFFSFAFLVLSKSILSASLGIYLAVKGMPEMILFGEAAAFAIVALVGWKVGNLTVKPNFMKANLDDFRTTLWEGAPIAGSSLARKISFNVDRWLIAAGFGAIAISEYTFVMLTHLIGISLMGIINTALVPTMLSYISKANDFDLMIKKMHFPLLIFAGLTFVTAVVAHWTLPIFLSSAFPVYSSPEIVMAISISVVGVGAYLMSALLEWVVIGLHRAINITSLNVLTVIATLLIFMIFVASGYYSIIMFSLAFSILRIANLVATVFIAHRIVS